MQMMIIMGEHRRGSYKFLLHGDELGDHIVSQGSSAAKYFLLGPYLLLISMASL